MDIVCLIFSGLVFGIFFVAILKMWECHIRACMDTNDEFHMAPIFYLVFGVAGVYTGLVISAMFLAFTKYVALA